LISFIVAAVAASKVSKSESDLQKNAPAASFSAVWTSLVLIVLSVVGTAIMRRVNYFSAQ